MNAKELKEKLAKKYGMTFYTGKEDFDGILDKVKDEGGCIDRIDLQRGEGFGHIGGTNGVSRIKCSENGFEGSVKISETPELENINEPKYNFEECSFTIPNDFINATSCGVSPIGETDIKLNVPNAISEKEFFDGRMKREFETNDSIIYVDSSKEDEVNIKIKRKYG